jgi:6-phosphogluconolactonase/glucosamine-6-phosphate isomerase/deaminase
MIEAATRHAPCLKPQPHFNYRVLPAREVARTVAKQILKIADSGRGTVLTPGCNTPLNMYKELFIQGGTRLGSLLTGEMGDFQMGMIDGVEAKLEHPYSFRFYYIQHFLRYMMFSPLHSIKDPQERAHAINWTYAKFKNVFVPHLTEGASPDVHFAETAEFRLWLKNRGPIDLLVCGLGPDGHIAFLGPGERRVDIEPPAKRVKLWDELRQWKWQNDESDETCMCVKEVCENKPIAPEHALTVSLSTILSARRIIMMAMGQSKAEPVQRLIQGELEPESFTAHHLAAVSDKVTILMDEGAAGLL